jgi:hypothetical protein
MAETDVALELFLRWLNESRDGRFRLEERTAGGAIASGGGTVIAVEARPLIPAESPAWLDARAELEAQLTEAVPAACALWAPAGARLPAGEPALSEFREHVRRAALRLGPHERSYVPLPVTLYLRKNSESGAVVSVTGGLNPYWARFTDRVRGTYDLDSTQLHRLPESDEHLEELIGRIVERSKRMETGQISEIETFDAWTVQRLDGERGVTVIGIPPGDAEDMGLAVRRNLRRILAEAGPALRSLGAGARALVLLGYYARMEQEGARVAMRGYDPSLYAGIDYICLVADGLVKPLIGAPARARSP